jgi:FtsZ-binding cell division protein ZapB
MCTGLEILSLVGTAVSTIGTLQQGQQQKKQANFQAAQAQADAQAEREQSQVNADKIRRAGKYQQSEARSALAKSGVVADAGTAVTIQDYIGENAEEDALQTILTGQYRSDKLDQNAALLRQSGKNAVTSSIWGAGSSLLSGGRSYLKPGYIPQQAPAPVEERSTVYIR